MIAERGRVYVVDDDEAVRRALARLAEAAGLVVETYASAEAFLKVHEEPPNGCLLLDVRMPNLDGPELHARLLERGWDTPVIYLTGHDVPLGPKSDLIGQAQGFFRKPPDIAELMQSVRSALSWDADMVGQGRRERPA